jgi:hypothetical protein
MLRDHGGSSVSKSTVSCANLIHLDLNPRGVPTGAMKSDLLIAASQRECSNTVRRIHIAVELTSILGRMIRVILFSDNRQRC